MTVGQDSGRGTGQDSGRGTGQGSGGGTGQGSGAAAGQGSGRAVAGRISGPAAAAAAPLPEFAALPDLASRQLGGSVVAASDELFAEKENLIKPGRPAFDPGEFGSRGKVYDGWETRRRREPGSDHAIVRLGASGVVHGVVVDTAFFRGNYPPQISVEALAADGYPSPQELAGMRWQVLVARTAASGDAANAYQVTDRRRWTHVRLSIYPDGGVARFRVHGEVLPDPRFLAGTIDLAAAENGGSLAGCSDAFYASAANLLLPGRARDISEGWENARRRGPGNDFVIVRLSGAGTLRHVEVDTSCFIGNAPGWVRLLAADARGTAPGAGGSAASGGPDVAAARIPDSSWWEALPKTRVQPDTRHRFLVDSPRPATHIRLDAIPDGGLARLRVYGQLLPDALAELERRWLEAAG
jgi:allantoicase